MTLDEMHAAEAYRRVRYFRKLERDVLHAIAGLTVSAVLVLVGLWVAG